MILQLRMRKPYVRSNSDSDSSGEIDFVLNYWLTATGSANTLTPANSLTQWPSDHGSQEDS